MAKTIGSVIDSINAKFEKQREDAAKVVSDATEQLEIWQAALSEAQNKLSVIDSERDKEIAQALKDNGISVGAPSKSSSRKSSGGGGRSRLSKADIEALTDKLRNLLKGKKTGMSRGDIAEALGVKATQAATIIKKVGAKMKGEKANATYTL
ncbi:hypothetical protein HED60_19285 [Planctomycetales bacterium ZRK34]|nr:hypothetical protein HED60_19285 [Planctomycetales bacterium ZRK34]